MQIISGFTDSERISTHVIELVDGYKEGRYKPERQNGDVHSFNIEYGGSEEYFEGYREYCRELYDHGAMYFQPMNPDAMDDGWFARTKSIYDRKETEEAPGQARSIHYWAVDDGRFIGEFQLRLDFTDKVMNDIGSVGYAACVSKWGKGFDERKRYLHDGKASEGI